MGRHVGSASDENVKRIDAERLAQEPRPGSRRALMRAERLARLVKEEAAAAAAENREVHEGVLSLKANETLISAVACEAVIEEKDAEPQASAFINKEESARALVQAVSQAHSVHASEADAQSTEKSESARGREAEKADDTAEAMPHWPALHARFTSEETPAGVDVPRNLTPRSFSEAIYGTEQGALADISGNDEESESSDSPSRLRSFFGLKRARATSAAIVVMVSAMGAAASVAGEGHAPLAASHDKAASLAALSDLNAQATTFTLKVDGTTRVLTTHAKTLADALAENGIIVGENDRLSSAMAAPVINGSTVSIVRVKVETVTETVEEPYATQEVEDANLEKGKREVTTKGVNGRVTNTYEVTYEDGVEKSRTLTISAHVSERVDEVVHVGTKEKETSAAGKSAAATAAASGPSVPAGDAQQIAHDMVIARGWGEEQFTCLVNLWNRESNWRTTAANPSGAYGIPQALPGSKMASAGADWQTNPATQITWGLGYISGRYGTPCGAWAHSNSVGWY